MRLLVGRWLGRLLRIPKTPRCPQSVILVALGTKSPTHLLAAVRRGIEQLVLNGSSVTEVRVWKCPG
jgi:hypothetical protein